MSTFPTGTETPFARAVSAEIRAVLAARRLTLRELAIGAGFKSHNYIAIRLRDEKPFTLDDVERIVAFLEGESTEAWEFIKRADESHAERLWIEATELEKAARELVDVRVDFELGDGTKIQVKSSDYGEAKRPGQTSTVYLDANVIAYIRSRWADLFRREFGDLSGLPTFPNTVEELLQLAEGPDGVAPHNLSRNKADLSSFDDADLAARDES